MAQKNLRKHWIVKGKGDKMNLVCSRCGKEFIIIYNESKKKHFKTCEVCREKGRLAKKRWAASKKIYVTSKVDEIVKECEEYNKAHGTHLSYGKYKELKRQK